MRKVSFSNRGYSLTEVLISVGILGLVVTIVSSVFVAMQKQQKAIEMKGDAWTFVEHLKDRLLKNPATCQSVLGTTLTLPTLGTEIPITLGQVNFNTLTSIADNTYVFGQAGSPNLRITRVRLSRKPGVVPQVVRSGNINYQSDIAVVRIGFEQSSGDQTKILQDAQIEVPVLTTVGGLIQMCRVGLNEQDVCAMIGANYNVGTGECIPVTQCQISGSYVVSTCTPAYAGCSTGIVNPVTGSHSCGGGLVASKTGESVSTFNVSCGKKCTQTITNRLEYFLCTRCN